MSQPIAVTVTRHQCPHCRVTRATKKSAADHIARCSRNPAVRDGQTLRLSADDVQIGDVVHAPDGSFVAIRDLERGPDGRLTVNPGAADQLDGYVWQGATVTRPA